MAADLPDMDVATSDTGDDKAAKELDFYDKKSPPPEVIESRRKYIRELMEMRAVFFWGARLFTRIVALLLIGAVVTWWWHLIGPQSLRWLSPDETQHLQALISSGAVAALVTAMGKRLFPEPPKD